ncbi:MAG: right-handed parallel beta-helix repeat-containing protein, partial [Candidatus Heimdallarchaeota archaeon]|nr:right-handed parallel beta-helix repeat-containing protein [Candidatus Heimdallarchaeota archaeon]
LLVGSAIAIFLVSIYYPPATENFLSITSDEDFIKLGFPGNGSRENPYMIENIEFGIYNEYTKLKNATLVSIQSTTKHFVIRNCTFARGALGLYVGDVEAGTARIENNIFISKLFCMIDSEENYEKCYRGDALHIQANGVTITNNTFSAEITDVPKGYFKAIIVQNSKDCIISENTIEYCIESINIYSSENITVCNNYFDATASGVYSIDSDSILVDNNIFLGNYYYTMYFKETVNVMITNNNISLSGTINTAAIGIVNCSLIQLSYNFVSNATIGIRVYRSQLVNIVSNELWKCNEYAIYLFEETSNTTVYYNVFMHNGEDYSDQTQCCDDGTDNYWYNSTLSEGNYWNDIGNYTVYEINGSAGSIDLYPLSSPIDLGLFLNQI